MNDEEIIASLVKGRERCRQIVQLYQNLRGCGAEGRPVDPVELERANGIMTQMLGYLHALPHKPSRTMTNPAAREHAEQLLREVGDLLETAIVAERELRDQMSRPVSAPAGTARMAAMRSYGA